MSQPKPNVFGKRCVVPAVLLCGLGQPAQGQDQSMTDLLELSPAELANISVSIASGTAKSVSQSAAVTTVITADQISAMGATELHEVLETVPGMHVSIQPVTNDYTYTMRGMRNQTNSEVLLMLNGTRFSIPYQGSHMAGMIVPVENIQRVEVIRGPGSALYGADAFAGVINIVTKKAGDLNGTTLGARGGSADRTSTWAQHGGHYGEWDVAGSLQYSHSGINPDRIVAADAQTALDNALNTHASQAPGAMQTAGERWNAHLNLQRQHWDLNFWAYNQSVGFPAGASGALDNSGTLDGAHYLGDVRYSTENDLENWELQFHTSFLHTDLNGNSRNFPVGTVLPIDGNGNLAVDANGNLNPATLVNFVSFPNGMRFVPGIKNTVPSTELTSIYKGFENHLIRLITGFRYEELNVSELRNYGIGVIDGQQLVVNGDLTDVTGTPYAFMNDTHRSIWSVALQDEWQISKNWQLTAGLRYDEYSDFGGTLNPRAALVWDINDDLTGKLLYGQAYRAPSFVEQYQKNNPLFVGNASLSPETIETTELAFDYRPWKSLRTTLNVYYYEINDLIGGKLTNQGATLSEVNNPGQDGLGSEFEWDWKFYDDWNLRGNYAWQYAVDRATQRRVSNVPEHHVYTALSWNFHPKWQIQTQVNWVGHRLSDIGDNRVLKDYQTVDLTLNAKKLMGSLDLTASVRNLFDSQGKEPAIASYPYNLPISAQTFYFEAALHF
ncbi:MULTISPECIES: TonB-dependent receptor plug domain-containing protein [Methylomonas]|uniref:TonB-dependent receptor n=1 Tax=Methylomonas koyamae TaxID=702114 RepID=A0A177N8P0_9GAMM|nr:TonB-dependent receptor [Methylomonas koyamae]OAI14261.1 TonB-dependent receptor [Methylomonas koyamae]